MEVAFVPRILIATAVLLVQAAVVFCVIPATLTLERGFPTNHGVELSQLRARDRIRHGRLLKSSEGVIDFSLSGTYNPFKVGLYYTKVKLGTPPKDFHVQIDTGSDVLWVSCASCNGCPQSSGLQIDLNFFDPTSSSSSSLVSCSDQICILGFQSSDSTCSAQNNECIYAFQYGDGSGTSGYYVSDLMQFDTIVGDSTTSNSSASVVFGCSKSQTGDLTKTDRAVDGIFGFGQQNMSVVSQLSSKGIAPKVFSHCLRGDNNGGGILVLDEIVHPSIVYSPLVPAQPHYNLNLQSISVNGQTLSINPTVFSTSANRGTIVDSGTTLAYLAEGAYDTFITSITNTVSQSTESVVSQGSQCYALVSSVSDVFPEVGLNFAGGASMILRPQDYLIQQTSASGASIWCIGFQRIEGQGFTILGDLVLKDKIVVYDLAGQRIGWTNYDCSMPVNVSGISTKYVNTGSTNDNSSTKKVIFSLHLGLIALLVHLWMSPYTCRV